MKTFSCAALLCLSVGVFFNAEAANTYLTNPVGFSYTSNLGVSAFGKPGGMLVPGGCNRYDPAFAAARANGAELLVYLNPSEVGSYSSCSVEKAYYSNNPAAVPRWPYPSYGYRSNWPGTKMTDIRAGSVWSNRVVAWVEQLMREDKVDGVMLDVVGARLWSSLANWNSWPQWEKDAWTRGCIDLVRRLDASRRAINPRFIIVNNGVWFRGDALGPEAEKYVDGILLERHAATSTYHRNYAGRAFSNLGHRRVLVISRGVSDALAWKGVQGVTHITEQTTFTRVSTPVIPFNRLIDRPKKFGRTSVGTVASSGLQANYKRGSKFTLNDKARILKLSAYLDGSGGMSGSQSVRMALYRGTTGPTSLVVQSNPMSLAAGLSPRWIDFPTSNITLDKGTYWIVLHSGTNNAVTRSRSDGLANYYGNNDTYSDGAASTFGTGVAGTSTLSVNAAYTVGW